MFVIKIEQPIHFPGIPYKFIEHWSGVSTYLMRNVHTYLLFLNTYMYNRLFIYLFRLIDINGINRCDCVGYIQNVDLQSRMKKENHPHPRLSK